jgi:uncharacterized protein YqgV (UPF0045/DUF77 family)
MEKVKEINEIMKKVLFDEMDISLTTMANKCNCSMDLVIETIKTILSFVKEKNKKIEKIIKLYEKDNKELS